MGKKASTSSAASSASVVSRRSFNGQLIAGGLGALAAPLLRSRGAAAHGVSLEVDYVVVGAGAGGGPVAARLAQAGYRVALLEAGVDPTSATAQAIDPNSGLIYSVPALAAVSSEHPVLSWDFFVKHYGDPVQQARDPAYVPGKGILYPRGSTLGGSTAHDAMVFVYPRDADWNDIADMTDDDSWRARHMRKYFQRLESCDYCQPHAPGHGFNGYMSNELFDKQIFDLYPALRDLAEAKQIMPSSFLRGNTTRDINHPLVSAGDAGTFNTPMHVAKQVRVSIREHLAETQQAYPDRLQIITGALATRVLLEGRRAVGVEFMQGGSLYEADKLYDPSVAPPLHRIRARREVILSAGVFNTPQLLKLSGIGPKRELRAMGIPVVADLRGVGENLQDRYEITVNADLETDLELYTRCLPFQPTDPCLVAWLTGLWTGASKPFYGPYGNNALYTSRIAKSSPHRALADLFLVGQATQFHGFFPGYSQMPLGKSWTWLILKTLTNNRAGTVKLRSKNPRQMPEINFHYFEEGSDKSGEDLRAVVEGIKLARSYIRDPQAAKHIRAETAPGNQYQTDKELADYVRDRAWGHHASCTARIGGRHEQNAVLDSRFRVRDIANLRVVDACAFPRVPGFFPVAATLMIGEKAADSIIEDAEECR